MKHNCLTCRFENARLCRRSPPVPVSMISQDAWGNYKTGVEYHQPSVWDNDWCGEYKHDKVKFAAHVLTAP